jgi:hypothetical protein
MTTLFDKYSDRMKQADQLIRMKATGNPSEFAQKLNISKSHLYNLLEDFKGMGLLLSYSKSEQSYHYERPSILQIEVKVVFLDEQESVKIEAGQKILLNFCQSNFIGLRIPTLVAQ